ncbi:MAG: ATP-binding protein, partial [Candidatus Cloacimonadota bacterium]
MIEKTGFFYIGKEFSMGKNKTLDNPILYDSRDLTTHAVCIGMTGSGKTGLCIDILEEATLNGIPSIIVDPKGDMTNLLLVFPNLLPEDFLHWVNPEDARREDIDLNAYAERVARTWKEGLGQWGIESERMRKYKETAEFRIYTPGSRAGFGVSILSSLLVPKLSWDKDEETLREKIRGTVSALLGLINYKTDPIRSKEHILLSNIFEHFWRKGEDLSLEKLIGAIGNPPFEKLGVLSLETFIPRGERQKLLLDLNSIIAAPSFNDWIEGAPLDIGRFLRGENGRPRVSIFYTAHLSDNEKLFFTSLLLEELLTWVRGQPGTTDLKSLLYIDEVFGYIPPYPFNPPTKKPLLLLFKQARAFGTGVMLTTQNPVDIDYKALTNAGTWFIGKLQTERDKDRLLEGLETVSGESGELFDRKYLDHLISSLKKRVFIHHNVHNEKPEI